jgi:two-component sensor histidine kinase
MKQSRQENIIYLVVWGLLFAAPLLSLYVRTANDANAVFEWTEVFIVWRKFAVFLLLFLIHNFLLAPLLVHGRKRKTYFAIMAMILVGFTVYQCNSRPDILPKGPRPPMEQARHRQMGGVHSLPEQQPPFEDPSMVFERERPPRDFKRPAFAPPPIVGERNILAIIVLILMFGANLGIKGFFRSRDDRKRLAALEKQNLEQQLEYLRYQINPHFFMNTLNNIHALVDIDPEKAKDTILELSKMMRFVLYEGNKQGVPLSRELDFIRHYVTLMQLRYTDKVRIGMDLPQEVPDRQVPPLILITFIENAFKHGISYQHESFIEVVVSVEDQALRFTCRNSKAEKANEEKGGVGLENIRRRLNLIYDKQYSLKLKSEPDTYTVELNIPLL